MDVIKGYVDVNDDVENENIWDKYGPKDKGMKGIYKNYNILI